MRRLDHIERRLTNEPDGQLSLTDKDSRLRDRGQLTAIERLRRNSLSLSLSLSRMAQLRRTALQAQHLALGLDLDASLDYDNYAFNASSLSRLE